MTEFLGINFPTPDITGLLSSSWIYVAIIGLIVVIAVVILVVVLFFMTYNKWVELYENIGGGKVLVRTLRKRARLVKVGPGGEEMLKIFLGPVRTAYGKKIAVNTYAFKRGSDGFWYNSTLKDSEPKDSIFEIEATNENVRMMNVANEIIIQKSYDPNKNTVMVLSIVFAVLVIAVLVAGYIYLGKMGTITKDLGIQSSNNKDVALINAKTTQLLISAGINPNQVNTPTGLAPAG